MILNPDRKEIARYLGYHGITPDAGIMEEIDACVTQLQEAVTPRFVYEKFAIVPEDDADRCTDPAAGDGIGGTESRDAGIGVPGKNTDGDGCLVRMAGLTIRSRDLARNLKGCCAAYLMAVTLGPGPDALIRRASVTEMSRAVILQAAAAAMAEEWCDAINARILTEAAAEGFCALRPRFSPGYGDLPLEVQRDISAILNMPKEIGVSLTDTFLMIPGKSITAIVGVARRTDAVQETETEPGGVTGREQGAADPGARGAADPNAQGAADPGALGAPDSDAQGALPAAQGCSACSMQDTCAYRRAGE